MLLTDDKEILDSFHLRFYHSDSFLDLTTV